MHRLRALKREGRADSAPSTLSASLIVPQLREHVGSAQGMIGKGLQQCLIARDILKEGLHDLQSMPSRCWGGSGMDSPAQQGEVTQRG